MKILWGVKLLFPYDPEFSFLVLEMVTVTCIAFHKHDHSAEYKKKQAVLYIVFESLCVYMYVIGAHPLSAGALRCNIS